MRTAIPCIVAVALMAGSAAAQATAALDPEGVYIDSEGVLKTRKVDTGKRLRELRKRAAANKEDGRLVFISLPRLFAQVREKLDAGQKLPDEMRYLKGMVKLQFVFVYPEEKDLVIAGPAEPIDAKFPGRPVGRRTGRPVLQLDDLVVALRTCGPGKVGDAFGCTIQQTADGRKKMLAKLKEREGALRANPKSHKAISRAMAEAGGLQPVKFFALKPDTRFAFVCLEADYLMKRQALGLDRSPVKKVKSNLALRSSPETTASRFWFETLYEPLKVSPDGNAFEIQGQSLQILTRSRFIDEDKDQVQADATARKHAELATRHFSELAKFILPYADLANLADLSLLAALIGQDNLHQKTGWDLGWILDTDGYPVAKVRVPESAQTLANSKLTSRTVIFASGGVKFTLKKFVTERTKDERGTLAARADRPDGWGMVKKDASHN